MKILNNKLLFIGLLLFAWIAIGCVSHLETVILTPTGARGLSTSTNPSTLFRTDTPAPSTPLPTDFPTPTAASTSTWTTLPTLMPTEVNRLLLELYKENAGCRLPCWWGFEPGITDWEHARTFLEQIALAISSPDPDAVSTFFEVLVPTESGKHDNGTRRQIYRVENGIIKEIEVNIVNLSPYGDLLTMLQTYGSPDEIWVSTGIRDPILIDETTSFNLIVFYQELGIMISYEDPFAEVKDKSIIACPHLPGHGLEMVLWDPGVKYTFDERLEESVDFPKEEQFKSLHEATGISIDDYVRLLGEDVTYCLKTPRDIWPRY